MQNKKKTYRHVKDRLKLELPISLKCLDCGKSLQANQGDMCTRFLGMPEIELVVERCRFCLKDQEKAEET